MALKNLHDLFVDELRDMFDAEHRITKALPKLIKAATSRELSSAFEKHLKQSEGHITRLTQIFEGIHVAPTRKTCQAMLGLLKEGEELMAEDAPESVKDAALIAAAQKVEHYEMATYGCLRDWAQLLDYNDAATLLQQTLDEEGQADKKFTECAKSLNVEAVEGEFEDDERETVSPGPRMAGGARSARTVSRRKAH